MFLVILAGNSPKVMTSSKPQIQEAKRTPSRKKSRNKSIIYPGHHTPTEKQKQNKTKQNKKHKRDLERSQEQRNWGETHYFQRTNNKNYIRPLSKTHGSKKRIELKYLKLFKEKIHHPKTQNPVKLSSKCEEEINIPSEKQKLDNMSPVVLPCKKC